ncbi:MAG: DedA family protein, partial [Microbacteriaceae bacterium]
IPPVAEFVKNYIDIVLLAVILVVLVPSVFHYIQTLRAARRERHQHAAGVPETVEAQTLVLDQSDFVQNPHGKHADDNS